MPFPLMIAMSKLGNTDFLTFYDHERLCGFIYLAKNRKLVFVMFLAIAQSSAFARVRQSHFADA